MDGYKACRIYSARPDGGDITDVATRPEAKGWLLDTLELFRPAVLRTRAQIEAEVGGVL